MPALVWGTPPENAEAPHPSLRHPHPPPAQGLVCGKLGLCMPCAVVLLTLSHTPWPGSCPSGLVWSLPRSQFAFLAFLPSIHCKDTYRHMGNHVFFIVLTGHRSICTLGKEVIQAGTQEVPFPELVHRRTKLWKTHLGRLRALVSAKVAPWLSPVPEMQECLQLPWASLRGVVCIQSRRGTEPHAGVWSVCLKEEVRLAVYRKDGSVFWFMTEWLLALIANSMAFCHPCVLII